MFLIDVNPAKNENVVDTELKATDKVNVATLASNSPILHDIDESAVHLLALLADLSNLDEIEAPTC
jgi:hypothetical protein